MIETHQSGDKGKNDTSSKICNPKVRWESSRERSRSEPRPHRPSVHSPPVLELCLSFTPLGKAKLNKNVIYSLSKHCTVMFINNLQATKTKVVSSHST